MFKEIFSSFSFDARCGAYAVRRLIPEGLTPAEAAACINGHPDERPMPGFPHLLFRRAVANGDLVELYYTAGGIDVPGVVPPVPVRL